MRSLGRRGHCLEEPQATLGHLHPGAQKSQTACTLPPLDRFPCPFVLQVSSMVSFLSPLTTKLDAPSARRGHCRRCLPPHVGHRQGKLAHSSIWIIPPFLGSSSPSRRVACPFRTYPSNWHNALWISFCADYFSLPFSKLEHLSYPSFCRSRRRSTTRLPFLPHSALHPATRVHRSSNFSVVLP